MLHSEQAARVGLEPGSLNFVSCTCLLKQGIVTDRGQGRESDVLLLNFLSRQWEGKGGFGVNCWGMATDPLIYSLIHSFVHSFNKYLLSSYCVQALSDIMELTI